MPLSASVLPTHYLHLKHRICTFHGQAVTSNLHVISSVLQEVMVSGDRDFGK